MILGGNFYRSELRIFLNALSFNASWRKADPRRRKVKNRNVLSLYVDLFIVTLFSMQFFPYKNGDRTINFCTWAKFQLSLPLLFVCPGFYIYLSIFQCNVCVCFLSLLSQMWLDGEKSVHKIPLDAAYYIGWSQYQSKRYRIAHYNAGQQNIAQFTSRCSYHWCVIVSIKK